MITTTTRMHPCMLLDKNYPKPVLIRNVADCNWSGIFLTVTLTSLFHYVYINEQEISSMASGVSVPQDFKIVKSGTMTTSLFPSDFESMFV